MFKSKWMIAATTAVVAACGGGGGGSPTGDGEPAPNPPVLQPIPPALQPIPASFTDFNNALPPNGGVHKAWDGKLANAFIKVRVPEMERVVAYAVSDANGQFEFSAPDKAILLSLPRVVLVEISGGDLREPLPGVPSAQESQGTLSILAWAPQLALEQFNFTPLASAMSQAVFDIWSELPAYALRNPLNEMALRVFDGDLNGNAKIDYDDVLLADTGVHSNEFLVPYADLVAASADSNGITFESRFVLGDPSWTKALADALPEFALSPADVSETVRETFYNGVKVVEVRSRGIGVVRGELTGVVNGSVKLDPQNQWQKLKLGQTDTLTLTAEAPAGYRFAEWSSGCSDASANVCAITFDNYSEPVVATFAVSENTLKAGVPNAINLAEKRGAYTAIIDSKRLTVSAIGANLKAQIQPLLESVQPGTLIHTGVAEEPYVIVKARNETKSAGDFIAVEMDVEPVENLYDVYDRYTGWGSTPVSLRDMTSMTVPNPSTGETEKVILRDTTRPQVLAADVQTVCPVYGDSNPVILEDNSGMPSVFCLSDQAKRVSQGDYCDLNYYYDSLDGRSFCSREAAVLSSEAWFSPKSRAANGLVPQPKRNAAGTLVATPVWLAEYEYAYHLGEGRYLVETKQGRVQLMMATSSPVLLDSSEAVKLIQKANCGESSSERLGDFQALCDTTASLFDEIEDVASIGTGNVNTAGFSLAIPLPSPLESFSVTFALAIDFGTPSASHYSNVSATIGDAIDDTACSVQEAIEGLATSAANWTQSRAEDAVDNLAQAAEEVGGFLDDVVDTASNVGGVVIDGVVDGAQATGQIVEDVAQGAANTAVTAANEVANAGKTTVSFFANTASSVGRSISCIFGCKSATQPHPISATAGPVLYDFSGLHALANAGVTKNSCVLGDIANGALIGATYLNPYTAAAVIAAKVATGDPTFEFTDLPAVFEAGITFNIDPRPGIGLKLAFGQDLKQIFDTPGDSLTESQQSDLDNKGTVNKDGTVKNENNKKDVDVPSPFKIDFGKALAGGVVVGEIALDYGIDVNGEVFINVGVVVPVEVEMQANLSTLKVTRAGITRDLFDLSISDILVTNQSIDVSYAVEITGGATIVVEPYAYIPKVTLGIEAIAPSLVETGPKATFPFTFYATGLRIYAGDSDDVQQIINPDGGNRDFCIASLGNLGIKMDVVIKLAFDVSLKDSAVEDLFPDKLFGVERQLYKTNIFDRGFNPSPSDANKSVNEALSRTGLSSLPGVFCPTVPSVEQWSTCSNRVNRVKVGQSIQVTGAELVNFPDGRVIIFERDGAGRRTKKVLQQLFPRFPNQSDKAGDLVFTPSSVTQEYVRNRNGLYSEFVTRQLTFADDDSITASPNCGFEIIFDKNGLSLGGFFPGVVDAPSGNGGDNGGVEPPAGGGDVGDPAPPEQPTNEAPIVLDFTISMLTGETRSFDFLAMAFDDRSSSNGDVIFDDNDLVQDLRIGTTFPSGSVLAQRTGNSTFTLRTGSNTSGYSFQYRATDSEGASSRFATVTVVISQDTDGDGIIDTGDNCPNNFNPDQADENQDGVGDACEATGGDNPAPGPNPNDPDGDGLVGGEDPCPDDPDNLCVG